MMNGYWWRSNSSNNKRIRWLAWDRMCVPKCKGGMGFRSLHGFNLALLEKHVWKFIQDPNSLVARIFKARYFSECNVLHAVKGNGSSFIWTGIWEAKEQMGKGYRWVLGDGEEIKAFTDPWLRGKNDFCVEGHHLNGVRDDKVSAYFRPNTKEWDVHKVQQAFHADDVQLILQTRIPKIQVKDMVAWTQSSNGQYTVKTGYHYWFSQNNVMADETSSKGWNRLWNVNLPHKIKIFLWRFCKNNIPVRKLLRGKGVSIPILCPMCEVDVEHMLHVFFDCAFANQCWQKVGLVFDTMMVESAPSWLLNKLSKNTSENIVKIATVLWGVWFARNKKVWENIHITPDLTVELSHKQIADWQEAMRKKQVCNTVGADEDKSNNMKWEVPEMGWSKLNVDASVYNGVSSFTIGMVMRDDLWMFVQGKNLKKAGVISVLEAEAIGVLEAIDWIEETGSYHVILECDSLMVVNALQKNKDYQLEIGNTLEYCRAKLGQRNDLVVRHVRKQANRASHLLARFPCLLDSYNLFMSPPQVLLETLLSDILVD